ncbi:MAG: diacylglycerol/lipid kinase family protein [Anaerolineales bacterium]
MSPKSKDSYVILNPAAGSGNGLRQRESIEGGLAGRGISYQLELTTARGQAMDLARRAVEDGWERIIAAGGDGTANEVINGMMAARNRASIKPALGVIGVGRGNDFAHGAGIPGEFEQALDALQSDSKRTIDLGRVRGGLFPGGRYFGNCVGVGFDAVGTIEASKLPRLGGFLSFFFAVLKTIFIYHRGPLVRLTFDGETLELPVLMVSIMNGKRLGGGFWMAPDARPDDGLLDLCIVRQVTRRRIFGLIPHFMRGTQGTQPEVRTGHASRIHVEALRGVLPAQTDGEIICIDGRELEVEILPAALQVLVGEGQG